MIEERFQEFCELIGIDAADADELRDGYYQLSADLATFPKADFRAAVAALESAYQDIERVHRYWTYERARLQELLPDAAACPPDGRPLD
jgi:hypothetical protein